MIERLSGMEALLCWRPRYSRLNSHCNDSPTNALNNQICSMDIPTIQKTSISIIKNIETAPPVDVLDPLTLASSWFLPKVSRTKAEEILATSPIGSFLLRASSSPSSAFALSVRVDAVRVQHHLLLQAGQGVSLNGSRKVFPNLGSLVTHLSIMREALPCCLILQHTVGLGEDIEEEEEDIVDIDSDKEMEDCVNCLKMRLEE